MKLVSWNVAEYRAGLKKGFADFFEGVNTNISLIFQFIPYNLGWSKNICFFLVFLLVFFVAITYDDFR